MEKKVVTCSAPVNIAVVKYWGKRNEDLILPVNSSLSVTLDQSQLKTTTSIFLSDRFTADRIWINGREESIDSVRLQRCLTEVRRLNKEQHPEEEKFKGRVHICSENNFPTAAGLASSAAGYACLVSALAELYEIKDDISRIARQGSGSACRSVYGGFVAWEKGERDDGRDSIAVQVAPASHWPQLELLVLVVSAERKPVSSSAGMQSTVHSSTLLQYRADELVPQRMEEMKKAVLQRDFQTFAKLTMQESNQFHAVCLDSYPPIFYLNDTSRSIIRLVTKYNELQGEIKVGYTFDAGPNAVLFALSPDVPDLLALLCHFFPPAATQEGSFLRGLSEGATPSPLAQHTTASEIPLLTTAPGALQYILHTKVGEGPAVLDSSQQVSTQGLLDWHN